MGASDGVLVDFGQPRLVIGGGYYQESGYLTTSFDKTASVWYDRCSNSIRSAIGGSMTTLASAYNASRIISYVVIRTWRYADIPLLDMRVHDIDVAVNMRATLPWVPEPPKNEEPVPVKGDGTYTGRAEAKPQLLFDINALEDTAASHVTWYWTGPWPILHLIVNWAPVLGSLIKLHFGFELLPPYLHLYPDDSEMQCFVAISSFLGIPESQEASVYAAAARVVDILLYADWFKAATCASIIMLVLGWIAPGNPLLMAAFYVASIAYAASIVMAVIQTLLRVQDGTITPLQGCLTLLREGLSWIFLLSLAFSAEALWAIDREYKTYEILWGLTDDNVLLKTNEAAGLSLFSIWLTLVMGLYMMAAGLIIAWSYRL